MRLQEPRQQDNNSNTAIIASRFFLSMYSKQNKLNFKSRCFPGYLFVYVTFVAATNLFY